MDKSLNMWVRSTVLGNGHWDSNVRLLEVRLSLRVMLRSNTIHNNVLLTDDVREVVLIGEISKLHICLVAEICSWLDLLELIVPESGLASIGIDTCGTNACQLRANSHAKHT